MKNSAVGFGFLLRLIASSGSSGRGLLAATEEEKGLISELKKPGDFAPELVEQPAQDAAITTAIHFAFLYFFMIRLVSE